MDANRQEKNFFAHYWATDFMRIFVLLTQNVISSVVWRSAWNTHTTEKHLPRRKSTLLLFLVLPKLKSNNNPK